MASTSNEEDEKFLLAVNLVCASVLPMVLRAALEMDVLEIIAKAGPGAYLSPAEITTHLPTNNPEAPDMIDRILRLLATYSVVACTQITADDGRVQILYGLTPACKFLVQNQDGASIAPWLLFLQDKVIMESWYHLQDAVLGGGIPFDRANGMNLFEYSAKDSRVNEVFNRGMKSHSTTVMMRVLETYRGFEGVKQLVDVGGGVGASLDMIVSKYPHIKGINFDLPHVLADAPSYSSGVVHTGGDMFVSVPSGDAIFLKGILHDWSDEKCLKLLKNCYQALADSGKVIVVELNRQPFPETNIAANCVFQLDMIMLALTPGGRVRTEKEFETLGKAAGFACFKPVCSAYCYRVMEFHKNM